MMVHVILSVIEVSFHMLVGMGLFIGVYGRKKGGVKAVSYTHLDVYKRQIFISSAAGNMQAWMKPPG